jgi:hypothetical protein
MCINGFYGKEIVGDVKQGVNIHLGVEMRYKIYV